MSDEEKKQLLSSQQKAPVNDYRASGYGSVPEEEKEGEAELASSGVYTRNRCLQFMYENRERIPGYGVLKILTQGRLYSVYVLIALLVVYLLNQLDRYTLPVVTTSVGPDLRYGDKTCQVNPHVNSTMLEESGYPDNYTDLCVKDQYQHHNICESDTLLPMFNISACRWWWSGEGILYQVVAGPVFNNLYPLAGLVTGFLADYGNRKVFLVISLVFWSLATGLTGFAQYYWTLVLLRALLAIGAAGCNPFAVSILADYFPKELRGSALGIYYFGIYIGYSLSFAIGNGIVEVLNWRWVFFISGIAGIVVAPIVLFTVKEPERTSDKTNKDEPKDKKISTKQRFLLLLTTFLMPGMFVLCIAGGIRNAGGYVWAYNTQVFFQKFYSPKTINHFMSWIPLVGGSLGAVVGGVISDFLVKNRGTAARIWVMVVSQLAAAPFAAGALFLPYPWCFLSLIPSNVIGEMWIGVTSAIIIDLAPAKIRTASLALYFFIITVIGGNFNVLVPPIMSAFQRSLDDVLSYRLTLLLTFPSLYVIGAFLFLLSYYLMRIDLRKRERIEQRILLINNVHRCSEEDEDEEENDDGEQKCESIT